MVGMDTVIRGVLFRPCLSPPKHWIVHNHDLRWISLSSRSAETSTGRGSLEIACHFQQPQYPDCFYVLQGIVSTKLDRKMLFIERHKTRYLLQAVLVILSHPIT